MAGGRAQHCLCHDGRVVMFFVVLCGWLGKKRQRNTRKTVQEEIQPAELSQLIFCAGFNQSSTNKQ